jgi:hypothetical protein
VNSSVTLGQIVQTWTGIGLVCLGCWLIEFGSRSDQTPALICGFAGFVCAAHAAFGRAPAPTRSVTYAASRGPLDRVLLHWDAENAFTLRDLLAGGVSVLGRTGSGKTSSSGKALARAIVGVPSSAGLIVAAKPGEDRAMWQRIFRDAGRANDLLIFSPEHPLRFNVLDFEMRQGGHTRNITKTLTTIAETLRSSDTDNRESSDFWQKEQERMIFNTVEVVKLATGRVSAPDLHRFIGGAAMCPQQFHSPEWLAGFHNQCLKAAWQKQKSPTGQHDFELAKEYWLGEFPNMADKTRSSILVGVMGLIHCFNVGLVRELVSTTTNVTPETMFDGKWVLIDMPMSEFGDVGSFVIGAWKYLTQKAILRRVASEATPPVVIWADEAQQVVTSFDAHFLAQCRSHHGCMVYLSQSLPGYVRAVGGDHAKPTVDALQASFSTKVFHALGDLETATWASGLVGKSLQTFIGGSTAPAEGGVYEELTGRGRMTSNFSQHYESTLQANAFLHGLRTGGPGSGYVCDAYVIRTGEPFSNGENWLKTSFSQKDPK